MTPQTPESPPVIDRVSPTRRPNRRAVMRQDWHKLLFVHWEVPPEQLRPLLPPGLELDLYEGRAYVGLVPFTMTGVRPVFLPPVPGLSSFHETNVRTYVHFEGRNPGVWFFSLDAENRMAVLGARTVFHLPYYFAQMTLNTNGGGTNVYRSERRWPRPLPGSCSVEAKFFGPIAPANVGTLEHFLVERYILYASRRDRLYLGRIHHAPYPLQSASVTALDETLLAAAGIARPDQTPLAHYASEVNVEVFPLERVK